MAAIKTLEVTITTGSNGTLGAVYLGIAGREFRLNRLGQNDFMRNSVSQFVLGDATHPYAVRTPAANDPKMPLPLDTTMIAQHPLYLRLAGANAHWEVADGTIVINGGGAPIRMLPSGTKLLLGPEAGEFMYFKQ